MKHLVLAAFALVFALSLHAQTPGPEVTTLPIPHYGGHAVAADGTGFVFAWVENDHVFVARLDATLHNADGAVPFAFSTFNAGASISRTAVGSDGRNIVVVWQESLPGGASQNILAAVAHDLSAVTAAPRVLDYSPVRLAVRYAGGCWIVVTDWVYELDAKLAVTSSHTTGGGKVIGVSDSGETASGNAVEIIACSSLWWGNCTFTDDFTATWGQGSRVFEYVGSVRYIGTKPVIASNGSGFVAGWQIGREYYNGTELSPNWQFTALSMQPVPLSWKVTTNSSDVSFAGNGSEVLVVWATGSEREPSYLYGAILGPDGTQTPFGPLANVGQHPQVVATAPGTFVLTYEIPKFEGTIVAGRLIRLAPPRQRVAR